MINIQLIQNSEDKIIPGDLAKHSLLSAPDAFDNYKVNIINLNNSNIWHNKKNNNRRDYIDSENDLKSLSKLITDSKSIIVIMLPSENFDYIVQNND